MKGKRPRPIHPLLFGAFPVLFLVANNRDVTSPAAAALPLLLTISALGLLLLAVGRVLGSTRKVAVALSAAAIVFFAYGHVWTVLEGRSVGGVVVGRDLVLVPAFTAALGLVVAITARTKRDLGGATRALNTIAVVLAITAAATLVLDIVGDPSIAASHDEVDLERRGTAPDIYYLVFDRYPDAGTLRDHFGFDNGPFLEALRRRGFQIAADARANYHNTHLSLASTLSLDYLDGLGERLGTPTRDLEPAFRAMSRSTVAASLRSAGYRYVHVGSWWSPSSESPIADVNLRNAPLSEFTRTFLTSTALAPLLRRGVIGEADRDGVQYATTLRELGSLRRAVELDGPKFVFAHFLVPHPPYVFDHSGERTPTQRREGNVEGFLEQLRFTNRVITQTVDGILAAPGDPVVIVQADEGPYPRLSTDIPGAWAGRPDGDLRVKYGILSALRLPGADGAVYPAMSPVNSFRVVFSRYFGADLPLLPDRSFASRSPEDVYSFVPLGDRVRGRPPGFAPTG